MANTSTFEAWATKINGVADHTYVYSVEDKSYFNCWGGHSGPDKRKIVTGKCVYKIANCYRIPAFGKPDTAGIGIYAVDGVCHQSANCFLYYSRKTLTLKVRGYWATVVAYGPYGKLYPLVWPLAVYNPCYQKFKTAALTPPPENDDEGALFEKLQAVYQAMPKKPSEKQIRDLRAQELLTISRHAAPEVDAALIEELHRKFMEKHAELIASNLRGEALAKETNALSKELQEELSKRVDAETYRRLMGVEPGELLNIVNPEIAADLGEKE